ncbi:MAG: 3-phosphoshikimate 1-carboxyvinyltransferase [Burkholderiaceae bacterium]|nr:3-phosphoshikimate 1-carboxyvinyltransferase [Burkholderiaceae bacterium]
MIYPKTIMLTPRKGAQGHVVLPGSKSISNRVLLLAALAQGSTRLHHVLDSDDTQVMIDSLRKLGVSVVQQATEGSPNANVLALVIQGVAGHFPNVGTADAPLKLFIGNSGLTIRTLLPALVVSMAKTGGCVEIRGVERMHERPIADLVDGLRAIGAKIDYLGAEGFPPLRISGVTLSARPTISVKGSTSSQYLTGLMQAAPLLALQWQQPIELAVEGELISRPYVEITRSVLKRFGIQIDQVSNDPIRYRIGPAMITAAGDVTVEGDASSASYFLAAGAIGDGQVRVIGVGRDSVQGDVRFADALEKMGATITWGPDWIEATAPLADGGAAPMEQDITHGMPHHLRAIDLDCNAIPDAAMTLAVCALFANGPSTLRNIGSWRVKETDRIAAMANECRKLGAQVETGEDWICIHPPAVLQPATIQTYEDHRVAMSFSLASFGNANVRIDDPGCVAKTFPDYFEVFSDLCSQAVPVLAIDGPTASGKGTIASQVAMELGFGYLDSGALYRITALAAQQNDISSDDERALASLATEMDLEFLGQTILLDGVNISHAIRAEEIGLLASKIAVYPAVRGALMLRQRDFARLPGLVADGRDMGTVVFPNARLKVFLTATARARAERRYKQLIDKGFSANLDSLSADLEARDARDASRAIAPLKPASGAVVIDSTNLSIDEVVQAVVNAWHSVSVKQTGQLT